MKTFHFPGRGVGAFVLAGPDAPIAWAGLFLTGLDGRALPLECVPNKSGGFDLLQKRGEPVANGEQWPNDDQVKVKCGSADIVLSTDADGVETMEVDLRIDRIAAGGSQVTVSPPEPAFVHVSLRGVRLA